VCWCLESCDVSHINVLRVSRTATGFVSAECERPADIQLFVCITSAEGGEKLKCTYLLTYPWSTVHLEKLTGLQLVKKFPTFYGIRMIITAFTINRSPPVSILNQPNPVHTPTSHFLNIHPNIILPPTPGSPQRSLSPRCMLLLYALTPLTILHRFLIFALSFLLWHSVRLTGFY
jgi:hypothetical protein